MTSPSSPRVHVSTCTSSPRATWWAIAMPHVRVSSSGWAWTKSRRGTVVLSKRRGASGSVGALGASAHGHGGEVDDATDAVVLVGLDARSVQVEGLRRRQRDVAALVADRPVGLLPHPGPGSGVGRGVGLVDERVDGVVAEVADVLARTRRVDVDAGVEERRQHPSGGRPVGGPYPT